MNKQINCKNSYFSLLTKFFKIEKELFYLFIISLIIIIVRLIFIRTEEVSPYCAEIGNLLYSLAIGYITSYVFYYLVVFRKAQNDKKNISEFLIKYLSYLVIEAYRDFRSLKNNSNLTSLNFPPNKEDLTLIFSKLDKTFSFCHNGNNEKYNWYDYYKYLTVATSIKYLEEIWKVLPYLDTELIQILNSIKESKLFIENYGISNRIRPKNPSHINIHEDIDFHESLEEYYSNIFNLEKYLSLNYSEYKEFQNLRNSELDD